MITSTLHSPLIKSPIEAQHKDLTSVNHKFVLAGQEKNLSEENEVLVVLFYGVSCLGKSTFTKFIQQEAHKKQINFKKIVFDEIGGPILKQFREENPAVKDNEEIFFSCWGKIAAGFKDKIFEEISLCKPGKNIIFIDDGKLDAAVLKQLESPDLLPTHVVKLLAIYPKNAHNFEIDQEFMIPFSPQLILNLCVRCLNREAHETMDYIPEKLLQIVLSFTMLYTNVNCFKTHFLSEAKFTEMLEVPFHQEIDLSEENTTSSGKNQTETWTQESIDYYEEFKLIAKNVYRSIKAPFESLKNADITYLTQLKDFIQNQQKMTSLANIVNYGGKNEWQVSCGNILDHFSGMEEFSKENNMNRGN